MRLIASTSLIVLSTLLLGFAAFCSWHAPPFGGSTRDLLVLGIAAGGLAFALMAVREVRVLRAELRYTQFR